MLRGITSGDATVFGRVATFYGDRVALLLRGSKVQPCPTFFSFYPLTAGHWRLVSLRATSLNNNQYSGPQFPDNSLRWWPDQKGAGNE